MGKNMEEEYKEKFKTFEDALRYIADSQAKSEWLRKKEEVENRKSREESRKFQEESRKRWQQIEKHLAHITKLTGIVFDELEFQEEKIQDASKALERKRR
jgi:hypothetical protein